MFLTRAFGSAWTRLATLAEGASNVLTIMLDEKVKKQMARNWELLDEGAQTLLRDVLPRLDLSTDVMRSIIADDRQASGLPGDAGLIAENPSSYPKDFGKGIRANKFPGVQLIAECCLLLTSGNRWQTWSSMIRDASERFA